MFASLKLGIMVQTYNPSAWETKSRRIDRYSQGHPGLSSKLQVKQDQRVRPHLEKKIHIEKKKAEATTNYKGKIALVETITKIYNCRGFFLYYFHVFQLAIIHLYQFHNQQKHFVKLVFLLVKL